MRRTLFIVALALTLSPLTVYRVSTPEGGGMSGWLLRDHPLLAAALFACGMACWGGYCFLRRPTLTLHGDAQS